MFDCYVHQMIESSRVFIFTSNFVQIIYRTTFYYSCNDSDKRNYKNIAVVNSLTNG